MKKILMGMSIFLISLSVYAASIEGTYDCKVIEIDTKEVSTGVSTLKKTGKTYQLKSEFTDGSTYQGVGIYDERNHILALGAINPNNEKETGVTVAYFDKKGNISAVWTYMNLTDVGQAHCIKRV